MSSEPGGVYLHIPFCSAICPYCDFAVVADRASRRAPFVAALDREIRGGATRWPELVAVGVDSVYLGGGTPSVLETGDLARLLEAVRSTFPLRDDTRWFLEANPEDVRPETLAAWRRLGFSTLSLGIQSFDDQELRFLGRRHTGAQAVRAVHDALAAGFATISVDLIYGLPGQPPESWWRSLETAARLGPHHLSCYGLEIHERTPFGKQRDRGELREPSDEHQANFFLETHRRLQALGYPGYEVSNFARSPEHRSRHNRKYWHHVPYAGFGPSAHSFAGNRRGWNLRSLARWQSAVEATGSGKEAEEELTLSDLALETLMLTFRTADGVDLAAFERRFGFDLEARNRRLVERHLEAGHLRKQGHTLRPTLEGWAIADGLAAGFDLRRD